jgi:voltage-dependent calcium channel L type alpha-1D
MLQRPDMSLLQFAEHHSRNLGYNLFLTSQQQAWVDVQRMLIATTPQVRHYQNP